MAKSSSKTSKKTGGFKLPTTPAIPPPPAPAKAAGGPAPKPSPALAPAAAPAASKPAKGPKAPVVKPAAPKASPATAAPPVVTKTTTRTRTTKVTHKAPAGAGASAATTKATATTKARAPKTPKTKTPPVTTTPPASGNWIRRYGKRAAIGAGIALLVALVSGLGRMMWNHIPQSPIQANAGITNQGQRVLPHGTFQAEVAAIPRPTRYIHIEEIPCVLPVSESVRDYGSHVGGTTFNQAVTIGGSNNTINGPLIVNNIGPTNVAPPQVTKVIVSRPVVLPPPAPAPAQTNSSPAPQASAPNCYNQKLYAPQAVAPDFWRNQPPAPVYMPPPQVVVVQQPPPEPPPWIVTGPYGYSDYGYGGRR